MTFGTEWTWGCDYKTSKEIFETFTDAGGNFIDTANLYTNGTSERFTGDLIRADRDHFVLATKYTLHDRPGDVSFSGNNRKNMIRSVEASLKRLNTPYIDLLWLHAWDFMTPVDEVMRALDDLVRSGKVHYVGISDTPAWIVAQANTLADLRGWTRFIGLQIEYSLIERTPERDLLPMAEAFGMSVTPWGPLGGGLLTGKYRKGEKGRLSGESHPRLSDKNIPVVEKVMEIADKLGVSPARVALAWMVKKYPAMIPIIGATSKDQLNDSMGYLTVSLPDDLFLELEDVSAIPLGFPHDFLRSEMVRRVVSSGMWDKISKERP
jgi:aryl-alcohol dehydrogenase-like predicted oxidoreductase